MPQPIRSVDYVFVDFSPKAVLNRPNLAAYLPAISGIWNETETRFGLFLATPLGADARTGVAMFNAITNDGARRAAFDAVCNVKLSTAEKTSLQGVQSTVGARYNDRNKIVHGAWGISDTYPDALLWVDAKESVVFHTDMMGLKDAENDVRHARVMSYQGSIFIYLERDFIDIVNRMEAAYNALTEFTEPFVERAYGSRTVKLPTRPARPLRGKREPSGPNR
jgi:hypothetical protein